MGDILIIYDTCLIEAIRFIHIKEPDLVYRKKLCALNCKYIGDEISEQMGQDILALRNLPFNSGGMNLYDIGQLTIIVTGEFP